MIVCEFCGMKIATGRHHLFSQTKASRKAYGKLLDEPFNIKFACSDCHTSHAHIPKYHIWTEQRFREVAQGYGYELPEPKKSYKAGEYNDSMYKI